MKTTDLKPLMVFRRVNDFGSNPDVVVDEVYAGSDGPHTVVCHDSGVHEHEGDSYSVEATALVDEKLWTFQPVMTAAVMTTKMIELSEQIRDLKRPIGTVLMPEADLKRIQLYVDESRIGAHGYVDEEGSGCSLLIDNAIDHNGQRAEWRSRSLHHALPPLPPVPVGGNPDPFSKETRSDPLSEVGAVLWFMAQLVCDHQPLCAVKANDGRRCDCEKFVPDDDPWYARIKNALQLVSKLRLDATKKAICSCNSCGDSLKQGEVMVCKQCQEIVDLKSDLHDVRNSAAHTSEVFDLEQKARLEAQAESVDRWKLVLQHENTIAQQAEKLKHRRVIQVRGLPSKEEAEAKVYEVHLTDHVGRIYVVNYDDNGNAPESAAWNQRLRELREKIGDRNSVGLLLPRGWEFSVLELPWE